MEQLLNMEIASSNITLEKMMLSLLLAIILGTLISITYIKINKSHSKNLALTLFVLPMCISTIVMLIGNNIAGAFSLAGIFSVIRFRSSPGNTKDILFILIAMAIGLACALNAYIYAIIFCFISIILLLFIYNIKILKNNNLLLTILVPDNLNEDNLFNDILASYTKTYHLNKVRTKDLGSVFEFQYLIEIDDNLNKLALINDLRCRNGNMNIKIESFINNNEF